ncbi:hypothetical protein LCGC14_0018310 [marine sediment metagenome]|uniref:F5/8 type C domain-containing protein n=1 Tax=marine sediment metagenome TaxID=412755 RepID=A0A0F9W4U8_9ZZZZ
MVEPELPPTSLAPSQAKQVTFLKAFLLVVLTYITAAILLDYSAHFVHPEIPHAYPTYFRNGPGPALGDLKLVFDMPAFSPVSRPRALTRLVEIYNGKLRIWLAHYFPPHPSFSLHWLFILILSPIFLYKLVRALTDNPLAPWIGLSIYFASIGTLGSVAMLFRPAKPLAIFMALVAYYVASQVRRIKKEQGRLSLPRYALLLGILLLAFNVDETTYFIYASIPVLFYDIFFVGKRKALALSLYLLPVVIFGMLVMYVFPYLFEHPAGGGIFNKSNVFNMMLSSNPNYSLSFKLYTFFHGGFFDGARNLLSSYMVPPGRFSRRTISAICIGVLIYLIFLIVQAPREKRGPMAAILLTFGLYLVFQILVIVPADQYYYGSMIVVYVAIVAAVLLSSGAKAIRRLNIALLVYFVVMSLADFPATNKGWLDHHADIYHERWFKNYTEDMPVRGTLTYDMVANAWRQRDDEDALLKLKSTYPALSYWLFYELQFMAGRTDDLMTWQSWQTATPGKPLHWAVRKNHTPALVTYLAQGADVHAIDRTGATALHEAARRGHRELAQLLLDHGADVNVRDPLGQTPLHKASSTGREEIMKLLVASGANTDIEDLAGMTPSQHYEDFRLLERARSLASAQADKPVLKLTYTSSGDYPEAGTEFPLGGVHDFWETSSLPAWIQTDLGDGGARTIRAYALATGLHGADATGRMPVSWELQASDDGETWNVIDTQADHGDWRINERRTYFVAKPGRYRYYRLLISAARESGIVRLYKLDLF